jgi:hypothetical protein
MVQIFLDGGQRSIFQPLHNPHFRTCFTVSPLALLQPLLTFLILCRLLRDLFGTNTPAMYCLARSQRYSTVGARYIKRVFSEQSKKGGKKGGKESEGKYSSTVQLPTTQFSQRANAAQREPEIQQYWAEQNIYDKVNMNNQKGSYVLHDGPPYANGMCLNTHTHTHTLCLVQHNCTSKNMHKQTFYITYFATVCYVLPHMISYTLVISQQTYK